jgi:hypothetical protein
MQGCLPQGAQSRARLKMQACMRPQKFDTARRRLVQGGGVRGRFC